jgi:general stress protein CsbA
MEEPEIRSMRWQDWVTLILGLWLFVMPFVGLLPIESMAAANGYIFGAVIAAVSAVALFWEQRWEEWVDVVLGLWLIAAPFVLGFTHDSMAMWSSMIIGLFIAADALWAALTAKPAEEPTHPA